MNDNLRQRGAQRTSSTRVRSHAEELAVRLDAVEGWLAQRFARSEIVDLARERWGISTRQADRYIAQATGRWMAGLEPERETCRRRNLATVDIGIAQAFRERRLRDVASLVRLRAMLDGSLVTPPTSLPSPDLPVPSLPALLRSVGDLVQTEVGTGHFDANMQHEIMTLLDGLAAVVRNAPAENGSSG